MDPTVTLADIRRARERLGRDIYCSPLAHSETLSQRAGKRVYLKLENLQMTGAFKERGALNRMLALTAAERARGVVAASAGNHAQAVAYVARRLGLPACIVMPEPTPLVKLRNTRAFGAEVVLHGQLYADAAERATALCQERGAVFIHPFDDPLVIAGQGTIALELLEQEPELDAIVVPVGGGGLIAGVAVAAKALKPHLKIIGVESESFPTAKLSLEQDRLVAAGSTGSLADGIAVKQLGALPFAIMRELVDQMVTVSEEEIASAVLTLLEVEKTVGEGAAAAALAAVIERKFFLKEQRLAVVLSGGNIDVNMLAKIIERGLARDGRRVRLHVAVADRPGTLAQVATILAATRANVLEVHHDRAFVDGPVGTTGIRFTLETRDREHIEAVLVALRQAGYTPRLEP